MQEIEWIQSKAWAAFLEEHQNSNPQKLLLQYGSKTPDVRFFAEQVVARAKAKGKWDPVWFDKKILFPTPVSVEQSSSSATARFKASLAHGNLGIDLTGGFGIDTVAFAQRFKEWHYVERDSILAARAAYNFQQLGQFNITTICGDGPEIAAAATLPFDLIYADPSRRISGKRVIDTAVYEPDLTRWHTILLHRANQVVYKLSPMADIQEQLRLFEGTPDIHIVEWQKECKELLMHWHPNAKGLVVANQLKKESHRELMQVPLQDAATATATYAAPKEFLFEPFVSVAKAGVFAYLSQHFHLAKLHPDSHLYTGSETLSIFPGRRFKVKAWGSLGQLNLKEVPMRVVCKNHPLPAATVRKKYKIKDGEGHTLFVTTLKTGQKVGIICEEVA